MEQKNKFAEMNDDSLNQVVGENQMSLGLLEETVSK